MQGWRMKIYLSNLPMMRDVFQVFPDHELAMVVIGTIKGNGSGVIKPVTRLT